MKIHNKLFFTLFLFSLLLVSTLVILVQWSIGKGMVDYVNTREIKILQPLIIELSEIHLNDGGWHKMVNQHSRLQSMLTIHLAGSDFALPANLDHNEAAQRNSRRKDNASSDTSSNREAQKRQQNNDLSDEQGNFDNRDRRPPPRRRDGRPPRQNGPGALPERRAFRPPPGSDEFRVSPSQQGSFRPPPINKKRPPKNKNRPPAPPEYRVSYALVDHEKNYVVGDYPPDREYVYTDIKLGEQLVGYLAVSKRNALTKGYELDFIEQQQDYIGLIAISVMLLVIIVTLPLARHLVLPIRQLTSGMHKLTQGEYQQSLDTKRQDEFGQLSRDFNELATTLEQNETARKRWLANISHELRTPVAILRGELEAMLDGVRSLSLDGIQSANQEVMHLQRLIEDLQQLTSADIGGMKYRKKRLDLILLLSNEQAKYQGYLADIGLAFKLILPAESVWVYADETRMCQLFDNLINNCIKYASSGTQVQISLITDKSEKKTFLHIEDDGPGVVDEHLVHLFEHLYRVDDSRNSETGGTGLGLSICSHIVVAHQGEISANHSTLGGLDVTIVLPIT